MTTSRGYWTVGQAGIVLWLLLLGSGCATNRAILDVRIDEPENSASEPVVTIVNVDDHRVFELSPRTASIPSLKNGEIDDESITSRAIARKRNGFGKALGDILLPEGRTVEDLVREALVKAFREAGYRVVDDTNGESENGEIIPVEADIEQFWAWVTPGMWTASLECEVKVNIKGDVPSFENGETVRGYVHLHTQGATTRAWQNTIDKGIESFVSEVKQRLANG